MVSPYHSGPLSTTTHLTKAPKSSWRHCRPYQDEEDDTVVTGWAPQRRQINQQPGAGNPHRAIQDEEEPEADQGGDGAGQGGDGADQGGDGADQGGDGADQGGDGADRGGNGAERGVEEEEEEQPEVDVEADEAGRNVDEEADGAGRNNLEEVAGAEVGDDEAVEPGDEGQEMAQAVEDAGGGGDEGGEAGGEEPPQVAYQPLRVAPQGPRKRRRPPREQQLVDQGLDQTARPARARREPDHYGIEKDRGPETCPELQLTLSAPPSREITPLSTPAPSPDSTLELDSRPEKARNPPTWLSEDNIVPKGDPGNVLDAHRHWSIGGGETEQGTPYPMLDWTPRTGRQPPSC